MGLAEVEHILGQLTTDAELRERFVHDPLVVGREMGLSAGETRQVARAAAARIESYNATRKGRRLLELSKLLPLTQRVLADRFSAHFQSYASAHPAVGARLLLEDAQEFASHLEGRLREERVGPGWTLDLLRFEKARLKAADPSCRCVARYFRHDISRLVRSVARREETPTAARRSTVAVWWRARRRAPVRYAVFAAPEIFKRSG
ncbi:MAG TPA: hypothetical protein VFS10_06010 [Pyrinomonadaceae bacterium]|nr:hypothetical protein [Pyrinomonadaceae bacterium]